MKRKQSILTLALAIAMSNTALAIEENAPAPKLNSIKLSYTGMWITGYRSRARQHGFMDSGFRVEELNYLVPGSDISPYARVSASGLPEQNSHISGDLILPGGKTTLSFSTHNRRYRQVGLTPVANSTDRITKLAFQQACGATTLSASFEDAQRRINPEAPLLSHEPRTQKFAVAADRPIGEKLNVGIVANQTDFREGNGTQSHSVNQTVGAQLTADLDALSLVTSASYAKIRQSGLKDSSMRTMGIAGSLDIGDRTVLHMDVARQDFTMPNAEKASLRQRFTTGARLVSKLGGWGFQAGVRHREEERFRTDHLFVDVPVWNTFDVRLSTRMGSGKRLTLRGAWEDLRRAPVFQTDDTRQLFWDDKASASAKFDFSSDSCAGYAQYTFRFRQNKARDVELDWHNFAFGLSKQLSDKTSAYTEVSYDMFKGTGKVDGGDAKLRTYFPNSINAGAGLSTQMNANTVLSLGWNGYSTSNLWGSQLTGSLRRDFADGRALEIFVAPWSARDRLYGQTGYRSTALSVAYSMKF